MFFFYVKERSKNLCRVRRGNLANDKRVFVSSLYSTRYGCANLKPLKLHPEHTLPLDLGLCFEQARRS